MAEKNEPEVEPTQKQKEDYMMALYSLAVMDFDMNSEEFQAIMAQLAKKYLLNDE